jgi:hypothetical protein
MPGISLFKKTLFLICFITVLCATYSCSSPVTQERNQEVKKDTVKPDTIVKKEPEKIAAPRKEFVRTYNDNARFIAGLKGEEGSDFLKLESNPDWRQYAAWSNSVWTRLEEGQLKKVKAWAFQELAFSPPKGTVDIKPLTLFYPFSGADFLYANTLFPENEKCIMIGLEPVGKVPEIRKIPTDFWENYFLALRTAMDDILTASFFKTKDMKVDFKIQELKGTLPIMMVFLVRTGHRIVTMEPVAINDSGRIENSSANQYNSMSGIRITYEKENTTLTKSPQKEVYYFSIDLSNASLARKPEFSSFMDNNGEVITFIKSASYLMHEKNFATIRSLILKHSTILVEDDSGIPLKYFTDTSSAYTWTPQFYGGYKAPIPMFKAFYQEDLKNSYADTSKIRPLPFRIGYGNSNKSNILVVQKKKT